MRQNLPFVAGLVFAASCGGGSSPTAPPASPQVAGQYDVAVRLSQNDCAATPTVLPQPTSVAQAAGAADFTLTHGGLSIAGAVLRDGSFTARPVAVQDPQGPASLSIAGRFTTTGIEATVTVSVASVPACRYVVSWTGTKQGAPNVLG